MLEDGIVSINEDADFVEWFNHNLLLLHFLDRLSRRTIIRTRILKAIPFDPLHLGVAHSLVPHSLRYLDLDALLYFCLFLLLQLQIFTLQFDFQ